MSAPDHLIERAAALLRGAGQLTVPTEPVTKPSALQQPASPGPDAEEDPPPVSRIFVPVPQGKPSLVRSFEAQPALADAVKPAPARPEVSPEIASPPPDLPPEITARQPADLPPAPPLPDRSLIGYDQLQAAGMVMARGTRSRISEEYRIVLGRVLRALRDDPDGQSAANLILVTSAKPGEGKSFTALNLAGSIAQHTSEKVVLIDLDAKVRPLTALLGAADEPGFYELAANPRLDPQTVVLPTAVAGLSFIPLGHRLGEVDGQARAGTLNEAIIRIARHFAGHVVVLDAPPCLSTSDPSTVAPIVGQIVMVIEAERTQRSEVEAALDLVRVCPNITMLLNKVQLTSSHTFGAYDYYGTYS